MHYFFPFLAKCINLLWKGGWWWIKISSWWYVWSFVHVVPCKSNNTRRCNWSEGFESGTLGRGDYFQWSFSDVYLPFFYFFNLHNFREFLKKTSLCHYIFLNADIQNNTKKNLNSSINKLEDIWIVLHFTLILPRSFDSYEKQA